MFYFQFGYAGALLFPCLVFCEPLMAFARDIAKLVKIGIPSLGNETAIIH